MDDALLIAASVLGGMIDPIGAAFGIAAGVVWARGSLWAVALVGGYFALDAALQAASNHLNLYYVITGTCAVGLWAVVAFTFCKARQKSAAALKEQQTLKP